jgi:branched-chain amino acid transport system permease protein
MTIHHILAATDPFHWMLFIGLFLIGIVLFAPGGITALSEKLFQRLAGRGI